MIKKFDIEKEKSEVFILVPAFNEEKTIGKVIDKLKAEGYSSIVVINDGSVDNTEKISKESGAIVLRHIINRGLGGALGTGISYAKKEKAKFVVTFDADGQHEAQDIARLVRYMVKKRKDVVIGSRLINPKGMPLIRRIGNWGFNIITYILFGVWTTDSQSGLRCFNRKAVEKIQIKTNRMEVSSEIIKEVGDKKLKFGEIPIRAIYTDYSLEKGQSSINGIKILFKLILRRLMN